MEITKKNCLALFIYCLAFFFIALSCWAEKYFGRINVNQVLSTMAFGQKGMLAADPLFINRFVNWCLLAPASLALLLMSSEKLISYYAQRNAEKENSSRGLHKAYKLLIQLLDFIFKKKFNLLLLLVGMLFASYQFSLVDFAKSFINNNTDYFQLNYVDPKTITFKVHHPKSLILIYVEGLENTYADEKIFDRDLLKNLNNLKENKLSFQSYKQIPGTGWTIAALVATQCGVPLKNLTLFNENVQGQMLNHFLPRAKCLSDILADKGYTNIFMGGASLNFSGKGRFLRDHHYHEIYGNEEWVTKGILKNNKNINGWGLADDDLFAQVKIKLARLMENKNLFNLTILTVDTHGPFGYVNKTCQKHNVHDFNGIIECSADQLSEFIQFVKQKGWLDKVDIVVIGDHLAMRNPVYDKLSAAKTRSIFNLFISNQKFTKNTDELIHFDLLPTILNFIGIHYAGNQLGLGYSALSTQFTQPENRIMELEDKIAKNSPTYSQLWYPPGIQV